MSASPSMPRRAGIGLKPCHYHEALSAPGAISWFEVHAENYMGAGGAPHHHLQRIRRDHPISMHGVGLSIGSAASLDPEHLRRLSALQQRYEPALFSEHLAWSTHDGQFLSDLLPLCYDEPTLARVCDHVDQLQHALRRQVLIENPSTYVEYRHATMSEAAFITALCERTGCGLLLDVTNVQVSATNHGREPMAELAALPLRRVGEIHLAGHAVDPRADHASLLIDSHDRAVSEAVWTLYQRALALTGPLPTLIERDRDVPAWSELCAEAWRADRYLQTCRPRPADMTARCVAREDRHVDIA
ncbi:MAG: DUF692 domain-containing protein [Gammaproteobacteria bacterium]|nr:DUF692 domain-containing protein [Gammaproteobacteria bacterium]